MSGASKLDVLDDGWATSRVWHHMMELEKAGLRAASRVPDKGAPPPVASPDGPPHCGGNVPRFWRGRSCAPWSIRGGQFGPVELCEEHSQSSVDDRGRIASRDGVAQQILGPAQFFVRLATHGQLNLVTFGCEWGQVQRARSRVSGPGGQVRDDPRRARHHLRALAKTRESSVSEVFESTTVHRAEDGDGRRAARPPAWSCVERSSEAPHGWRRLDAARGGQPP